MSAVGFVVVLRVRLVRVGRSRDGLLVGFGSLAGGDDVRRVVTAGSADSSAPRAGDMWSLFIGAVGAAAPTAAEPVGTFADGDECMSLVAPDDADPAVTAVGSIEPEPVIDCASFVAAAGWIELEVPDEREASRLTPKPMPMTASTMPMLTRASRERARAPGLAA